MKLSVTTTADRYPETAEHLVVFVSEQSASQLSIPTLPDKTMSWFKTRLDAHHLTGKKNQIVTIDTGSPYGSITVAGIGDETSFAINDLRELMALVIRSIRTERATSVAVVYDPMIGSDAAQVAETISVAAHLADYSFTRYQTLKPEEQPTRINDLSLVIGPDEEKDQTAFGHGLERGTVMADGTMQARDFVNEPASHFNPKLLAAEAQKIADQSNGQVSVEILDEQACATLGMGAYLGVAQGSENRPQFIILRYHPGGAGNTSPQKKTKKAGAAKLDLPTVCFVGKSVTFDTGGYSLKPTEYMYDMKLDMAGGAAVLGLFSILAHWDEAAYGSINYTVTGILPACENMISGNAYRPGDIVTAMNGTTIEVLNTDAEGRLTLADAMSYADQKLNAEVIIDLATLTGASMVALGTKIAALMDNDQVLADAVQAAADAQGEHLWRLPLPSIYEKLLKSEFADLRNIPAKRFGDAIFAGMFLKQFVGDRRWAHLDIAGPAFENDPPNGLRDHGGTGYGVRTLLQFLTTETI